MLRSYTIWYSVALGQWTCDNKEPSHQPNTTGSPFHRLTAPDGQSDCGFHHIIDVYLASPEWANLAPRTRQVWRHIVERIRVRWGTTPMALWSEPKQLREVIARRNAFSHQPRTADHQITVLHHLLNCARLHGEVSLNIAANIPRLYKNGMRAEIIWHDEEIARFCAAAPIQIADGMRLAVLTGLRRADLVGLTWSEIEPLKIKRVTQKSRRRRKRAIIPMTPALRELLDELATRPRQADVETVLVNSRG